MIIHITLKRILKVEVFEPANMFAWIYIVSDFILYRIRTTQKVVVLPHEVSFGRRIHVIIW
jgi:hypothetical protein